MRGDVFAWLGMLALPQVGVRQWQAETDDGSFGQTCREIVKEAGGGETKRRRERQLGNEKDAEELRSRKERDAGR